MFSTIQVHRSRVSSWWRKEGQYAGFDALHIATPVFAAAFAEIETPIPYSLALDVTRAASQRDLGKHLFSTRAIARERPLLQGAETVAALSRWAAASAVQDGGVDADRVLIVPPSVDFNSIPLLVKKTAGSMVNLLFVGNDFQRKGGDLLVSWHQRHFADVARLHIVTKKPLIDNDLKNVVWHGSVPYAELLGKIFPNMDIFCLPTRADMSPWVLTEASACGLPIVTFRVGGIPDLCLHGETGFVLDRNDLEGYVAALERLIQNFSLREDMGHAARRHAEANLDADKNYGALFDRMVRSTTMT